MICSPEQKVGSILLAKERKGGPPRKTSGPLGGSVRQGGKKGPSLREAVSKERKKKTRQRGKKSPVATSVFCREEKTTRAPRGTGLTLSQLETQEETFQEGRPPEGTGGERKEKALGSLKGSAEGKKGSSKKSRQTR